MARRTDSKLVALRKKAQKWARARKEQLSSVHLLAAVCETDGPARALLLARRLDESAVVKAARAVDEGVEGAIDTAFQAARELMRRAAVPARDAYTAKRGSRPAAAPEPDALHVLVALLSNRRYAAYRALDQHGVDIARLRNTARSIALGMVAPPRRSPRAVPARQRAGQSERAVEPPAAAEPVRMPRPRRTGKAIPVPLIPPLERTSARRRPAPSNAPPAEPKDAQLSKEAQSAKEAQHTKETQSAKGQQHTKETQSAKQTRRTTDAAEGGPTAAVDSSSTAPAVPASIAPAQNPADATPTPPSGPRPTRSAEPRKPGVALLSLDDERLATLARAGINLTVAAARGELDPVVGRDEEIEQVLDILAKRHENGVLLVGPPGVGKSSIIAGVAQRFARDSRKPRLLVELTVAELLSVTSGDGRMSIAERMANLCREVTLAEGAVVLVIDDLPELLSNSVADEAVLELKLALSRGGLPLIAVATPRQRAQLIASDAVLSRRLTELEIEPPDEAEALVWLRLVTAGLGAHHGVGYADDAIAAAVSWTARYMPARALPGKALSVLDLAGARTARRHAGEPAQVSREGVAQVLAEAVDVPYERLLETDQQRMLRLATLLDQRVVGHRAACERIAAVLRRNAAGLRSARPIGTLLLLGPTGVGKTETAKAIAELLFDARDAMTRLDMSEYAEPHAVARLVGAPPGYVGHEAGGVLTEALRRRPYQVVLLDEIEKAHRDVLQAFLQVFDEGRLTDGRGKTVDFRHTVIVLTSNLGAAEMGEAMSRRAVGFGRGQGEGAAAIESVAIQAARKALAPELYNRLDEVIFFKPLARQDVRRIAQRLLTEVGDKLAARDVSMQIDDAALDALLDSGGFDPQLGARPMRRAVARLVEAPIADLILGGELPAGATALVTAQEGKVIIDVIVDARRAG